MALVNTAAELAQRGQQVLVVDFDLEAPGLGTFELLKPSAGGAGIIDFVNQYLATGQVPDVRNFIGPVVPVGIKGGSIAIMPSGTEEAYANHFNQIDWDALYRQRDGYLVFEDLVAQWKKNISPDYVLIDSRTGYTDSGGICTRQLPNAVVALFFPNEQNLRGLTQVVNEIRAENTSERKTNIQLHFVMSNVPDLDDEDQILAHQIQSFKDQLGIDQDPLTVHHYNSLSLLNQVIFVTDRQNSRLANEYRGIVQELSVHNPEDRDGALEFIRRSEQLGPRRLLTSLSDQEQKLNLIEKAHPNDGLVLFRIANLKERLRDSETAYRLVNQAIVSGYTDPEAFLKRSEYREKNDDLTGASEDVWQMLDSVDVSPPMIIEAVSRLIRLNKLRIKKAIQSQAISSLDTDDAIWLATHFEHTNPELYFAQALLEKAYETQPKSKGNSNLIEHHLTLLYMGLGDCKKAVNLIQANKKSIVEMEIVEVFNYGMAKLGTNQSVDKDAFHRVIDIDAQESDSHDSPNYFQCLAVAHWLVGHRTKALECISTAYLKIGEMRHRNEFSCWRYRHVSPKMFIDDLDEMSHQFENNQVLTPKFITVST